MKKIKFYQAGIEMFGKTKEKFQNEKTPFIRQVLMVFQNVLPTG